MTTICKTSDIKVLSDDRQRRKFSDDAINNLAESILQNGLLHPIILTEDMKLVAGERRLRAVKTLNFLNISFNHDREPIPVGYIPYTLLSSSDEIAAYEAELEENIQRENLTVQEQSAAIAKLHRLRKARNPNQTLRDTAAEIAQKDKEDVVGTSIQKVRDAILIDEYSDDPRVKAAKTFRQAARAVVNIKREEHALVIAKEFGEKEKQDWIKIENKNVFDFFPLIPDSSIDVVCSDPPYGIEAENFGDMSATRHNYKDSDSTWTELMVAFLTGVEKKTKPQAHLYLFCDYTRFGQLTDLVRTYTSFIPWRRPLIWFKGNNYGMLPDPECGPRYTYELILFANRGRKKTTGIFNDVITIPAIRNPVHGAEKPPGLFRDILFRSVNAGDSILDGFLGTGPIIPVAKQLNLKLYGSEIDPTFFGLSVGRIDLEEPEEKELSLAELLKEGV